MLCWNLLKLDSHRLVWSKYSVALKDLSLHTIDGGKVHLTLNYCFNCSLYFDWHFIEVLIEGRENEIQQNCTLKVQPKVWANLVQDHKLLFIKDINLRRLCIHKLYSECSDFTLLAAWDNFSSNLFFEISNS